jgi:hypothetical protein
MRRTSLFGACLVLALLAAGPARAGLIYQYVTDQSAYGGFPGQVVNVNVFLQETVTAPSTSLLASEGGLFSGGFYVVEQGNPTNPATIIGLKQNPAFVGDLSSAFNARQARLLEDALFNTSGVTGTVKGNVTDILLGTLTVKLGGQTTSFLVEPYKFAPKSFGGTGLDGNTLTFLNGFDLDVTNNGGLPPPVTFTGADAAPPFTFTAAVPEPGTLALALVAAAGVGTVRGWRRWRRR